jgi:hypothetical protein
MSESPRGATYEKVVDRLIEARLGDHFRSLRDADAMIAASRRLLDPVPADERVIFAADWRRCVIMGAETAARVVDALVRMNPRTLRSGLLVMPNAPTAVMPMMRVSTRRSTESAASSGRRSNSGLSEMTTPMEQARLVTFLSRS